MKKEKGLHYEGKPTRVVYNENGFPVDIEFVNEEDKVLITDYAKEKDIKVYTEIDDILNELDEMDANPSHSEDAVKPKLKYKKKKKRVKVNPFNKLLNKFFGE